MKLIDGKIIADDVLAQLRSKIAGRSLHLAAVLVRADASLKKFVDLKKKAAESVGVQFSSYSLLEEEEVLQTLRFLSDDPAVQGILVELPLPDGFDTQKILDAVVPAKDVDVLSTSMSEIFYKGAPTVLPPAVAALELALKYHNISVHDKKVAVFGYGTLIGKPVAHWLGRQKAQVSVIDSRTKNAAEISGQADIVITGVGKPGLITGDMVKEGAVVIDYGYGKKDGKMLGDVDFESVGPKASLITPVPGGMGPLVVVAVIENLAKLAP